MQTEQILQKMCMDLNTVMKRFIVDKQNQNSGWTILVPIVSKILQKLVCVKTECATCPYYSFDNPVLKNNFT